MEEKPCLALLRQRYESLTPAERRIADVILRDPARIPALAVAELAKLAGAAPSAVVRLCQTLGYDGFTSFKLALARAPQAAEAVILPSVERGDSPDDVLQKVFGSGVRTLNDTLALLDRGAFARLVGRLAQARRILFVGVGTSSTLAVDAQYRLAQLGFDALCATDVLFMPVAAANLSPGDAAVAISHSGRTEATVRALRLARETGASTAAITSSAGTPICACADNVLTVCSEETRYPVEAVSARIAHISVLDALCVSLALSRYDDAVEHRRRAQEILRSIRCKG